jgi:cyanophycinase
MTVLMAIGGNMQLTGSIMQEFYQRSGGPAARVVIFPTASSRISGGEEYHRALLEMGIRAAPEILPVRERSQAYDTVLQEQVKIASGIFFAGGDQVRLTTVLAGTPLLATVRAAFERGVVVAGTSAGAAMMGQMMITGGRSGGGARGGSARLAEGFGFVSRVLIDQHFHQRNRLGRLMFAIALQPHLLGVGVDEDTAAVFENDQFQVIGSHAVTVLDGQDMLESTIDQAGTGAWLSISALRFHQLAPGCRFNLNTRTAVINRSPLEAD